MRIALVVPGGVDRLGQYRVIPALLALIRRLSVDLDVQVIATNQETAPGTWPLAGAHVHNIGSGHTVIRAVGAIRSLHRAEPFDVIHSIWSGGCGLIAVLAARLLGVPSVIHVAGGELVALYDINYGGRLNWRGRIREALVLRATQRITAASQPILQSLSNLGLHGERIPLGVDLSEWPCREPVRRATGHSPRLIHLASLNHVKDQTTLLRALALLKQSGERFQMEIVGEDTLRGAMQSLAEDLGLSTYVRFLGFRTQTELRPIIEAADILVMSSRHEAGPLAMLEAAVVGVPVVGTAVGHIAEWAPDAAVAVPVRDPVALAGAVSQLIHDEDLRFRIATAAHKRAVVEDADYTARQFETLYAELTRERR
ncbi:MAG: glycosyltransferase family 4 protein [Steroidobacteraceae bacterium]